jgi:N-acetylmuramoyl-L-alanine amidase
VLQKPRVQQAGFMVLKSPDIPSVLVETAFISNAREEQLLGSGPYQERIADALMRGIRSYMAPYRSLPKQQVAEADIDAPRENQAGGIIPVKMTKSAVR